MTTARGSLNTRGTALRVFPVLIAAALLTVSPALAAPPHSFQAASGVEVLVEITPLTSGSPSNPGGTGSGSPTSSASSTSEPSSSGGPSRSSSPSRSSGQPSELGSSGANLLGPALAASAALGAGALLIARARANRDRRTNP